jgi:hypothetical protein
LNSLWTNWSFSVLNSFTKLDIIQLNLPLTSVTSLWQISPETVEASFPGFDRMRTCHICQFLVYRIRRKVSRPDDFFDINQLEWQLNRRDRITSLTSGWIRFVRRERPFKMTIGIAIYIFVQEILSLSNVQDGGRFSVSSRWYLLGLSTPKLASLNFNSWILLPFKILSGLFPYIESRGDMWEMCTEKSLAISWVSSSILCDLSHFQPFKFVSIFLLKGEHLCENYLHFPIKFQVEYTWCGISPGDDFLNVNLVE